MYAALFPGQGSQHVGMGKFLYDEFKFVQSLFEEASDTLNQDFKKLCFDGSEEYLALTHNTQPALLLVSQAYFKTLEETLGFKPSYGAGHSLGEYSALVAARALNFGDALKAVKTRGEAMQKAVPLGEGGMLAVMGLNNEEVDKICNWAQNTSGLKPIEAANYNAPGQVVISGSKKLCEWLQAHLDTEKIFGEKKRVKLIPLNVSAPFHCSMMQPAQDVMKQVLEAIQIQEASFKIIQNFTAEVTGSAEETRKNLILQVTGSVKWVQSINKLKGFGVRSVVEVGAGRVLSGLVKKIDTEITTFNILSLTDIKDLEKHLKT